MATASSPRSCAPATPTPPSAASPKPTDSPSRSAKSWMASNACKTPPARTGKNPYERARGELIRAALKQKYFQKLKSHVLTRPNRARQLVRQSFSDGGSPACPEPAERGADEHPTRLPHKKSPHRRPPDMVSGLRRFRRARRVLPRAGK